MNLYRLGFVFLLALGSGWAQSSDASIAGSVTDGSGAAVAKARVTLENLRTGVKSSAVANEAGLFNFPAVSPGDYQLSAEADGFKRAVINKIPAEVGGRLNFSLQLEVGSLATSVEVTADSKLELAYSTSTVGNVITTKKVLELPITSRNALGLVFTTAGLVGDNFSGNRIGTLNIQIDSVNVQDARINLGVDSAVFPSVDRIEEFRVVTSPADAEFGRGAGQIQMTTRSGTNEYHGSLWNFHRNTALNGNNWFNNQRGSDPVTGEALAPREVLIRNQFGARGGGHLSIPKLYNGKNRTFFYVVYDGQRQSAKTTLNQVVYTDAAKRGLYRFFPGIQNGNLNAVTPVVDAAGNPVRPARATGDLQTVNVFGVDPRRTSDPTGVVRRMFDLMPSPNNFFAGDGLNTGGYTWQRRSTSDFNQLNVKLDHNINPSHRITASYLRETGDAVNGFMAQPFPNAPGGNTTTPGTTYSIKVTSTLTPNLVQETSFGALRSRLRFNAPWETPEGLSLLPRIGTQPYVIDFLTITDPLRLDNDPQGRLSPNYQWRTKTSYNKGKHTLKFGGELWFVSTNGFNSFDVMPRAVIGNGAQPVLGMAQVPGIGQNQAGAENLLNNLTGSLASFRQALNSPGGANPQFLAGEGKQRTWQQREYYLFFQDDWKVSRSVTLNLGMRYEFYGVPYDRNGRTAGLAGGSGSVFGISGRDASALFRPGAADGALTRVALMGRNSTDPLRNLYNNDANNFGPAVGISWGLPWFGKDKTILRAGYQMGYERASFRILDVVAGDLPGLRVVETQTNGAGYTNLNGLRLPLSSPQAPLATVPLTDRTQTLRTFDTGLRVPYAQNFNVSVTRSLPGNFTLDVRYVGSKGTRLVRGADMNEHNIFETGILDAFRIAQAGGNAPLFDRLFGANSFNTIAANTTLQGHLANGNVGSFARFLNETDLQTGVRGGLLRRAGLPENFIVTNPQFASARLTSNFASSTYHSMQIELNRRFSKGVAAQWNYTWSRALGEEEGSSQEQNDSYRNLRNRSFDRRLLAFHRTHVMRSNVLWDLPVGKGRRFGAKMPGLIDKVIGGW
ncbi:MAG: carboxypeptidase-like regulatory domain-containing protein, partial [Bryobacteraceae bacterium]|nr:carboxypeptidase-like regulatory domain-containing protein [Bryobacteraceae bacterium]